MVGEVNKIIFNMLISGQGVYLPEIGTLYIERKGAKKVAENRLLSPRNVVSFTTQVQATSLVDEIAQIASCETAQAQDIYDRWRAKTQEGNSVTIEGVGKLTDKSFAMEPEFNKTINPNGIKTIIVRRRQSHAWLFILSGVCIIIALAFLGYLLWGESTTTPTPAVTPAPVAQTEVTTPPADSLATDAATESADVAPAEQAPAEEVATTKEYAHYVVMGIFSKPENAENAIKQIQSKIEDANCAILPFKNKHMVTVFGSDNRADCNIFASSYKDIYPDLWVYDNK